MGRWSDGVVEWWGDGVLERWSGGVMECWSVGVMEWWGDGVVECWSSGVMQELELCVTGLCSKIDRVGFLYYQGIGPNPGVSLALQGLY